MKEWLDYATQREAQRVNTLQRNKAAANSELQKIRDRCWKRMKREREAPHTSAAQQLA